MKVMKQTLGVVAALVLAACSAETYVSQENVDKFGDPQVEKFLIRECIVPERDIHFALASHFEFDKAELQPADQASLDDLVKKVRKLHGQIAIVGHTDYQGSDDYNLKLSLARAEAVKAIWKLS